MSRKINKQYRYLRHNTSESYKKDDDQFATFEDYVNYLLRENPMNCDHHFISFIARCMPCDVDYDYVIKFETLDNDIEYLKQKLKISENHRKAVFPKKTFKASMDFVESTFKTIPKDLGFKLYEKYLKDFEVFGYEKPHWLCE